ncbi:hypothetical protein PPACK8108_LOCUS16043 [Phakopsora pachyrhizi]|uniref:Uncharacterized protein n=1 Tax=Phakopsora pachyrhizi TaxID=170000 RepID=A0AAV0BB42_PHAPC|nr:hypothetical protein PPACK8108_LOCUS16043 [Phakopsora pachyrhizi]
MWNWPPSGNNFGIFLAALVIQEWILFILSLSTSSMIEEPVWGGRSMGEIDVDGFDMKWPEDPGEEKSYLPEEDWQLQLASNVLLNLIRCIACHKLPIREGRES